MAGCERSGDGRASGVKRDCVTPSVAAQVAKVDVASRPSGPGMSVISSSKTIRRACSARGVAVFTTMPSRGVRMQDAARVRSPSISTRQARQLPSGR